MKNRLLIWVSLFAVWLCIGIVPLQVGLVGSVARSETADEVQPADPVQLTASIHRAADYLVKRCNHNGKFLYRINLDPEATVTPKYNFLRHAGAIYALGQYELT
ncbi:MAG: hypothetical protein JRF72_13165, partial [Deltaproteobacteria bacterium]|nr:hypothetical protein [Deltaproteobacteria bacterium]